MIRKTLERLDTSHAWNLISAGSGVLCVGLFVLYLLVK